MVGVPPACASALKEWATVLEAMARGDQLVLIRKGGLIEPGTGFELISNTFVFYPTFEHQTVRYLRAPHQRYVHEAAQRRAPEGQVCIDLFGIAVSSARSHDPAIVERLSEFHIYNQDFVRQRLRWQPEQALAIIAVRVFRLPTPQRLALAPHYAGCKSWVDLDSPVPLEGAVPVLDEAAFRARMAALSSLLPPA